jgi:hypothetical protein
MKCTACGKDTSTRFEYHAECGDKGMQLLSDRFARILEDTIKRSGGWERGEDIMMACLSLGAKYLRDFKSDRSATKQLGMITYLVRSTLEACEDLDRYQEYLRATVSGVGPTTVN